MDFSTTWIRRHPDKQRRQSPRGYSLKEYDKTAVADAMVEIFDRLYTKPLLGWRAFVRSALFTICMSAIFLYEFGRLSEGELTRLMTSGEFAWIIPTSHLLVNTVCDYVALFIIRRFLVIGRRRPIIAISLGPIAGISIVFVSFLLVAMFTFKPYGEALDIAAIDFAALEEDLERIIIPLKFTLPALQVAAFVVHMWLPLFGLCVILLRGLFPASRRRDAVVLEGRPSASARCNWICRRRSRVRCNGCNPKYSLKRSRFRPAHRAHRRTNNEAARELIRANRPARRSCTHRCAHSDRAARQSDLSQHNRSCAALLSVIHFTHCEAPLW
jgi:hypothetical protein